MENEATSVLVNLPIVLLACVILWVMAKRGVFSLKAFKDSPRPVGYLQGAGVLMAIGLMLIGQSVVLEFTKAMGWLSGGEKPTMKLKMAVTIIGGLPMAGFVLWYASMECEQGLAGFGLKYDKLRRGLVWGVLGSMLVIILTGAVGVLVKMVGEVLGYELPQIAHEALKKLAEDPEGSTLVYTTLTAVVCAPILEELLFRGMFQTWLTQSPLLGGLQRGEGGLVGVGGEVGLDRWTAIVVSSVPFALVHLGVVNIAALSSLYILSLGFGYVYEKTGSLWAPIVMHAIFNGLNVFVVASQIIVEGS